MRRLEPAVNLREQRRQQTVANRSLRLTTLRVIETFNQDRKQLTLSDLAKLVDLPRASVRRTLHTLVQLGYAEMDDRMFRLKPNVQAQSQMFELKTRRGCGTSATS